PARAWPAKCRSRSPSGRSPVPPESRRDRFRSRARRPARRPRARARRRTRRPRSSAPTTPRSGRRTPRPSSCVDATDTTQRANCVKTRARQGPLVAETVIDREEVVALLFNVSDIAVALDKIRLLLGGDDGEEEADEG